ARRAPAPGRLGRASVPPRRRPPRLPPRRPRAGDTERALGMRPLRPPGAASRAGAVLVQQPARRLPGVPGLRRRAHLFARPDHPRRPPHLAPGRRTPLGGLVAAARLATARTLRQG